MTDKKWPGGISGTSNYCAHRLHFSPEKIAVKPTAASYMFFAVFAFVGLGLMLIPWFAEGEADARIGITVFGLIFVGAGLFGMFRKCRRLPEIDLYRRMFYPERCKYDPADMTNISAVQGISLNELEKIVVSSRRVRGSKSSYTAFMLDLVFRDGYSCRLLSHGGRRQFVEDAEKLAETLNIPLDGMAEIECRSVSLRSGSIAKIVFSLFWLIFCGTAFSKMFARKAFGDFEAFRHEPGALLRLIIPAIFVLVGIGLFLSGIKDLVKTLKKPR